MRRLIVALILLSVPQAAALDLDAEPSCVLDGLDLATTALAGDAAACDEADVVAAVQRLLAGLVGDAALNARVEVNVMTDIDDDLHQHDELHAYARLDDNAEAVVVLATVRGPDADEPRVAVAFGADTAGNRDVDGYALHVYPGVVSLSATTIHVPACSPPVGPAVRPSWGGSGDFISSTQQGACVSGP